MKPPEEYFKIRKEDEYTVYEWQTNAMRVASGLLGMSFIFWILTVTDAIFKEGELTQELRCCSLWDVSCPLV